MASFVKTAANIRTFQLILLCLVSVANGYAQPVAKNYYAKINVEITKERKPKRIYSKVEIVKPFPGGDSSWIQLMEKRIDQSLAFRNGAKKGKYIVSVNFIMSKDRVVSDVQCVADPGFGMCEAVIRAIRNSPRWLPVRQPAG